MTKSDFIFNHQLFLKALLLSALVSIGSACAQVEHPSSMAGSMRVKSGDICQGVGLNCANAATPFFTQDGKLLLAWTANGVVLVGQSRDLGKTFSSLFKIAEHGKSLDTGADARPQIVADQNENVFIAYAFFKDANWNAQIHTARSTDGGNTFTAPASLVNDSASQRFPAALISPDGNIFISWIDKRLVAAAKLSGKQRLGGSIAYSFSQDGGRTFQKEQIANENSCECCRIAASLDPQSQPVMAYRAIFPGGIRDQTSQVISSKGAGPICKVAEDDWKTDVCPHHGPSIAVSGSGKFHVAWYTQGSKRSGVFYASSTNQGLNYSEPSRIGAEGVNVSRPYLFSAGQKVWLAWKEYDGKKSSVYVRESSDDGITWTLPKMVSSTSGYSDHPLILARGNEVFLSWLTREDHYQLISIGYK